MCLCLYIYLVEFVQTVRNLLAAHLKYHSHQFKNVCALIIIIIVTEMLSHCYIERITVQLHNKAILIDAALRYSWQQLLSNL